MSRLPPIAVALLLALAASFPVAGQSPSSTSTAASADITPDVRLGRRILALRATRKTADLVVIVPDERSYAVAISAWTPSLMWPVLIDGQDQRSAEDIGRFVRAFRPDRIVRFEPNGDESAPITAVMQSALARAWDVPADAGLLAHWLAMKHGPPGVVVTSARDPGRAAALALAAGHGQPLIFTEAGLRNANAPASAEQFDAYYRELLTQLEALGIPYTELGDVIDAITICANVSGRIQTGEERDERALTDLIGRDRAGRRFAYAGWIPTRTTARAAYMAMCSLFLDPSSALLFDGYADGPPWSDYSVEPAAELLARVGLDTRMQPAPTGTANAWRLRTAGGLDTSLLFLNSKGNPPDFDLAGGTKAWARDVPPLRRPTAAHVIHSWSAHSILDRNTVGGRFIDQGCFAYIGSMQEPYLRAFQPPALLTARLLNGAPWGAAPRHPDGPPWKVNVIGDPLFVLGKQRDRVPAGEAADEGRPLDDLIRTAMEDRAIAEAVRLMVMSGNDERAQELAHVAIRDRNVAEEDKQRIARAAIGAAFRVGSDVVFRALYRALPAPDPDRPHDSELLDQRDLLWSRLGADLHAIDDFDLGLLQVNLRWKRPDLDALRVADELARRGHRRQALSLLQELAGRTENAQSLGRLQQAIERLER
jgi:hypothetical protein